MDSLAANPSGSSGIYNSGGGSSSPGMGDVLNIVNQLKDREMRDFQAKSNFMSDLSLRQEARMRNLFNPEGATQGGQNTQGMNTVVAHDPNQITGFQRGELGVRQGELGVRQQQLAQTGKIGQERIDIQSAQQKLNQQKSDQINANKQADMQRKIDESNRKLELAQADLDRKTKAGEDTIQAHKDYQSAIEERHKLELAQKQHQFDVTSEQHGKQIKALEERVKQTGKTTTKTRVNAEGTERTTETRRGAASDTVQVTGRDGKTYEIPADKEDDWNANHAPEEEGAPDGGED